MMLYISMKFHENILNGFHTKLPLSTFKKGNNSKNMYTRDTVLVLCTSSDYALYFYEIS